MTKMRRSDCICYYYCNYSKISSVVFPHISRLSTLEVQCAEVTRGQINYIQRCFCCYLALDAYSSSLVYIFENYALLVLRIRSRDLRVLYWVLNVHLSDSFTQSVSYASSYKSPFSSNLKIMQVILDAS